MKNFIVILLVAMGLTYFVTANTQPVPIHFFAITKDVPLSFILIFPIGITLLVFAISYLIQRRKTSIIIHELEDSLQSEQEKVIETAKRTHELEIENRKLKIRLGHTDFDEDSL